MGTFPWYVAIRGSLQGCSSIHTADPSVLGPLFIDSTHSRQDLESKDEVRKAGIGLGSYELLPQWPGQWA